MISYNFENGLTIHEIRGLYDENELAKYRGDAAELAAGLANSTIMTARDDGRLVGLIRGVSDMHTILCMNDLVVLPEYSEDGVAAELLNQFTEYFKQVSQIVAFGDTDEERKLLKSVGFTAPTETDGDCLVRPRKILDIRY